MGYLSIPLSGEDAAALHQLAIVHHKSDSEFAAERLRSYIRFELSQLAKIQAGIRAADQGDFVPQEEMADYFARHGIAD